MPPSARKQRDFLVADFWLSGGMLHYSILHTSIGVGSFFALELFTVPCEGRCAGASGGRDGFVSRISYVAGGVNKKRAEPQMCLILQRGIYTLDTRKKLQICA